MDTFGAPCGVIVAHSEIVCFLSVWFYWPRDLFYNAAEGGAPRIYDWIASVKREMPGRGEVWIRRFTVGERARLELQEGWGEVRREQERNHWRLKDGKREW